jgi:hypothetical protein
MYNHIFKRRKPVETGADLLGRFFKDDDLGDCLVTAMVPYNGHGPHVIRYRPVSSAPGDDEEYSSVEEVRGWVQKTETSIMETDKHIPTSLEERCCAQMLCRKRFPAFILLAPLH